MDLTLDAIARRASVNFVHLATGYKIDVFVLGDATFDRVSFARAAERPLSPGGRTYRMQTAEDSLLRKLRRSCGEVSERQWHDVLGLLRVQGASLDRGHVTTWAAKLGVEDLLARAEDEARA